MDDMADGASNGNSVLPGSSRPCFFFDVSPLQEPEFTGIPQVVAKLCEQALGDAGVEAKFFYNRHEIPIWLVEHLLKERSGSLLRWSASRYLFDPLLSAPKAGQRVWGLHTNMKFSRRLFPIEGQIVHDLTTLVTPEHHTKETNTYHQTKFYGDLLSNDLVFAVSHSTAEDIANFYPETKKIPTIVTHLGVDWSHIPSANLQTRIDVEPYIFVLGTLEPRKNVAMVLDLLERDRALAEAYRFVFGGRVGWGDAFERQLQRRNLSSLAASGRIVQTGFVTESVKFCLLKHAAAVIYPSMYEGFGLPLAEAISLATPAVTTPSSSLPEVGRDFAFYFDPDSLDSFAAALKAAVEHGPTLASRSGESIVSWRSYFSWPRCYGQIRDAFFRLSGEL